MELLESFVPHAGEGQAGPARRRGGLVDREELVRIIAHSLYSIGYRRAAAVLEAESGVPLHPPEHDRLLLDVMSGRWDACVDTIRSVAGVGDADRAVAEFLVWRGHYLELLGTGDAGVRLAREVLGRRIAPLDVDRRCVHRLARAMVSCEGAVAPEAVVEWRIALFLDLIEVFPPWFHVPSVRLEHLVESAVTKQVASCIYHNLPDEITLFEDHKCHEEQIPSECAQVCEDTVVLRSARAATSERSVEVERERVRVDAMNGIAAARAAAERGAHAEAVEILRSRQRSVVRSSAARAGDSMFAALASELQEMRARVADRRRYELSGRAYVLAGLSSHAQQRATSRQMMSGGQTTRDGESVEEHSVALSTAGATTSYVTPAMLDMLDRSRRSRELLLQQRQQQSKERRTF